jgi:hypothetical protein
VGGRRAVETHECSFSIFVLLQPARHQVVGNGRLDFYAGAVLDVGADTDVPNAVEATIFNEDSEEAASDYEPLIALLCIFDDKPRHDFDDEALRVDPSAAEDHG